MQQPVAATNLTINPNTTNVSVGQDNPDLLQRTRLPSPAGKASPWRCSTRPPATSSPLPRPGPGRQGSKRGIQAPPRPIGRCGWATGGGLLVMPR